MVQARVEAPAESAAGWLYADPDGGTHDVINCSIAALELTVTQPNGAPSTTLRSEHGGAYELGIRTQKGTGTLNGTSTLKGTGERDHGVLADPRWSRRSLTTDARGAGAPQTPGQNTTGPARGAGPVVWRGLRSSQRRLLRREERHVRWVHIVGTTLLSNNVHEAY